MKTSSLGVLRGLALAFAAASVSMPPQAQSKAWFTLPTGATYSLVPDENGATAIRIPLARAASDAPAAVKLQLIDASFKDARPVSLANVLSAKHEPAGEMRGEALAVTVMNAAALRAGTYGVTFRLAADGSPEMYQDVVLSLQRPTLSLQLPPKIILKIVEPMWGAESREPALLVVGDSSGMAKLDTLKFADAGNVSASGLTGSGTLAFEAHEAKAASSARSSASSALIGGFIVDVTTAGPYELGKTSGRFAVQGPVLATDQSVLYEVNTARSQGWLVIIAALGAFVGWVVRIKATSAQKLADARIVASLALGSLDDARRRIPDRLFRKQLDKLRTDLGANDQGNDPVLVGSAAKAATDGLAAAITDFERRRSVMSADVAPYLAVVSKAWQLTDPATIALRRLRDDFDHAAELIKADDIAAAADDIEALETDGPLVAFVNLLNEANTALGVYVDVFTHGIPPISEAALTELRSRRDELVSETLPTSKLVVADANVLNAGLTRAHDLLFKAQQIVASVAPAADAFIDWATTVLGCADPAPCGRLHQATGALLQQVRFGLADTAANADVPAGLIEQLKSDWIAFLESCGGPLQKTVRELIRDARWVDAVNATIHPQAPKAAAAGPPGPALSGSTGASSTLGRMTIGGAAALRPIPSLRSVGNVIDGSERQRDQFQLESRTIAALQSAFFAVLFIGSVVALYGEAWTGTFREIFAIFLLAFGVDLTSDSVLALARRVKLPGSP